MKINYFSAPHITGAFLILFLVFSGCGKKEDGRKIAGPGSSPSTAIEIVTPEKTPVVTAPVPAPTPGYREDEKKGIRPRKAKFYRKW